MSEYSQKWNYCYESRDLEGMEKAYTNLKKYMKETLPLEMTIKEARTVENLHKLIKSKGDFNITEDEIKLAKELAVCS